MAGGQGQQTSYQESQPWSASQPYLADVMQQAQNAFHTNQSQNPLGPTYVGPDAATTTGLNAYEQQAMRGDPAAQQTGDYVGGIASGSTALGSQTGRGIFDAIARGQGVDPASGRITVPGLDTLQRTASGYYLNSNPNLDRAFDMGARKVSDAVSSRFFGQGEGSGYQQRLLQEGLGDLATNIYLPAYENERNRQQQAAGLLPNLQLAGASAAEGAASGDVGARYAAAGLLPGLREYGNAPLQDLLKVGAAREGYQQSAVDDMLARRAAPWQDLANYSGIISGFGGLGGSGTTTGPAQRTNPFLSGLSGAAGGAGLASTLGLVGTGWGAPLALGGGLLGLMG